MTTKTKKRFLALYLVWVMLHLILFLTQGNMFECSSETLRCIWPFHAEYTYFDVWEEEYIYCSSYDFSEFLLYTICPIFIYKIIILLDISIKPRK